MNFPRVQTCPLHPGRVRKCEDYIFQKIINDEGYSDKKVFINIPYLEPYIPFAISIWTTLICCNLTPVFASDRRISSRARICKICELIQTCKYTISDVSKREDIEVRPNVIFELGMISVLGRHGIVLIEDDHKYDERLSDYKIFESLGYNFNSDVLITKLLQWIRDDVQEVVNVPELVHISTVLNQINEILNISLITKGLTNIVNLLQTSIKSIAQYYFQEIQASDAVNITFRTVSSETEI